MWAKHRPTLAAPTDGWKQPHDDRYYRLAIQKSQAQAGNQTKELPHSGS